MRASRPHEQALTRPPLPPRAQATADPSSGPGVSTAAAGGRAATALLYAAVVSVGLMAGLFFAYDISVMPGLAETGDITYATAMQSFNSTIDSSGAFGLVFVGALVSSAGAALAQYRAGRRALGHLVAAATVCYLVMLAVTMGVNIPLNEELAAIGDPAAAGDLSVVDDFRATWVATNIARTALCVAALALLTRACHLHGRGSSHPRR
ncbi:anthrone oxygenase family protein [Streptomyces otsuchiensis]|uniref:anthrone oxygenase family protein n=1 Tax=Streptomyces otsuchiensis TaxID=2681388 RepID=UPI001300B13F|nr:DUF1772 domain-containing protein [Streptomyces otsuchiensis]